jgi:hypothetical protein
MSKGNPRIAFRAPVELVDALEARALELALAPADLARLAVRTFLFGPPVAEVEGTLEVPDPPAVEAALERIAMRYARAARIPLPIAKRDVKAGRVTEREDGFYLDGRKAT